MSDETLRETAKHEFAKAEKWISPQEAADQLGISIRAVQIRAQKGTLLSKREDRKLYVCLAALEEAVPRKADETFRETTNEGETPDKTPFALLEHQTEEIAFLRARIEEHEAEIRRRDVAESEFRRLLLSRDVEIGRLQERVQLLLAAPVEDAEASRLGLQKEVQPSDAAEIRQEHGNKLQSAHEAPQTQRRTWWKFWKRGDI